MAKSPTIRLSFDVTPKIHEQLKELQSRQELPSLTDVFRKSMSLFDMISEHLNSGGTLVLKNADGTSETIKLL